MKRQRSQPADSLELLLDTICNTFGGVLFIAILVVILLRLSGNSEEVPAADPSVTQQLQDELHLLNERRMQLHEIAQNQSRTLSELVPADRKQLLETLNVEEARHSSLSNEVQSARERLSALQQDQETLEWTVRQKQTELQQAQARNEQLQTELDNERQSRHQELRTSILRSPGGKRQVGVVLQYGRLYIWHQYDASGFSSGLNTADFLVLDRGLLQTVTTPNPTAGVVVDGSSASRQQILKSLLKFRPAVQYLAVIVRPDSYGSFRYLRDALTEGGFEYQLIPSLADEEFVDRGGRGGQVQ
ncbi:hypothetical protein [Planctomicrobium sp. SH664]|uniref:hypothetical protein n=1 Tax=Planctomicrobium sp. SH664 TaxID=3448125 RepID=UPI003F5B0FBD